MDHNFYNFYDLLFKGIIAIELEIIMIKYLGILS